MASMFSPLHNLFFNKWYFDEIYNALIIKPSKGLGNIFWRSDKNLIDGLGPDGTASLSQRISGLLSRFQNGFIFHYAFVMMIAVVGILGWFLYKTQVGG